LTMEILHIDRIRTIPADIMSMAIPIRIV